MAPPLPADAAARYLSSVLPGELSSINADVADLANAVQETLSCCQLDLDRVQGEMERVLSLAAAENADYRERFLTEEARRRKLLDQVHELKGNVRVVCRIRPVLPSDEAHGNASIAVQRVSREVVRVDTRDFEFDEVFGMRATQEDVFEEVRPMVESVMEGHHACIFAYGQTGSGKTHTMAGTSTDRGVNFRSLECLFDRSQSGLASGALTQCAFQVSNVEIYNERVRDLLVPAGGSNADLEIRQDMTLGVHLPTVKRMPAATMESVLDIIAQGQRNRAQGHTEMNAASSRSHSVVMIDITVSRADCAAPCRGRLVLVDLAGSERLDKSGVSGERQREAQNINKSLSALGDVIAALGSKQNHVPFRNSKLTYLLQDSLGADNKVMMIVQVAPTLYNMQESACTLAFGSRARSVELGKARAKEARPAPVDVEKTRRLEQRIAALEKQVAESQSKLAEAEAKAERAELQLSKTNDRLSVLSTERDELAAKLAARPAKPVAAAPVVAAAMPPIIPAAVPPSSEERARAQTIKAPSYGAPVASSRLSPLRAAPVVDIPLRTTMKMSGPMRPPRLSSPPPLPKQNRPSLDSVLPSPPPRQPQQLQRAPLRETSGNVQLGSSSLDCQPAKRMFFSSQQSFDDLPARRTLGDASGRNAAEERAAQLRAYKLAKEQSKPQWGVNPALMQPVQRVQRR